ncbi:unnamed protein product, partial [Amoebophrya sp. A120]|eukprot:GSA120T00019318001.1
MFAVHKLRDAIEPTQADYDLQGIIELYFTWLFREHKWHFGHLSDPRHMVITSPTSMSAGLDSEIVLELFLENNFSFGLPPQGVQLRQQPGGGGGFPGRAPGSSAPPDSSALTVLDRAMWHQESEAAEVAAAQRQQFSSSRQVVGLRIPETSTLRTYAATSDYTRRDNTY